MGIRAVRNNVICVRCTEEVLVGGIITPMEVKPCRFKIVSVGVAAKRKYPYLCEGMEVLAGSYASEVIDYCGKTYYNVSDDGIAAAIECGGRVSWGNVVGGVDWSEG